jgi:hypothetical protein
VTLDAPRPADREAALLALAGAARRLPDRVLAHGPASAAAEPEVARTRGALDAVRGLLDDRSTRVRAAAAVDEDDPEEVPGPGPWAHLDATLYPGCATPQVPKGGSGGYVAPLVVWGSTALPVSSISTIALAGALPLTTTITDVDADVQLDLHVRFATTALTRLSASATRVNLYGRTTDGVRLLGDTAITRPTAPPDTDLDGVHDACDACPTNGHPPGGTVGPDGCPP